MAKLTKTSTPGIFRRHQRDCSQDGRCNCRYAVVWRHRGKQSMETFATLAEAREAKGRKDSGDSKPASRLPFEDYARHWIVSYRGRTSRGLSERTRATYKRDLERWAIPYFRGSRLDEIEPPDVRAFIGHLDDAGLRANGIRSILAPVKAMYATAVEDGAVRSNPTVNVRIGVDRTADEPGREVRAMTRAELAVVLGHIPEDWRLLFELLAHSGLRISEAIGLTWADVELGKTPRLLVRRQDCRGEIGPLKSAKSRRDIPLSPGMVGRLRVARGSHQPTSRVFTSPQGFPISDGNLRRRVLIPAVEAAGLPWVTFHTFRHTCASLLFEAGRDVKQVSEWLGHADAGFTLKVYVHLMDSGVGDAAFMDDVVVPGLSTQNADPER